ncbi:hypothetical protein J6590_105757, partial [Homalodisca vitripennis]
MLLVSSYQSVHEDGRTDKPLVIVQSGRPARLVLCGTYPVRYLFLNRDISIAKDAAKCVECGLIFHVTCCRIRTLAKLTSMSARNLASWKCDDCSQDSSSVASHKSDSVDQNISDILLAIQKEIAVSQAANRDGFSAIEQRLTGLQASVDEIHKRLSSLEAENVELKAECVELRTKNESLSRR